MAKSLAKALKNAKISTGGNYIGEGSHVFEVRSAQFKETRKDEDMFAAELRVVKTDSNEPGKGVGDVVDLVFVDRNDAYLANVKAFLAAAIGLSEKEFDEMDDKELEEIIEDMTGQNQGIVGFFVECEAYKVTAKKINPQTGTANEYMRYRWSPVDQDAARAEYSTTQVAANA